MLFLKLTAQSKNNMISDATLVKSKQHEKEIVKHSHQILESLFSQLFFTVVLLGMFPASNTKPSPNGSFCGVNEFRNSFTSDHRGYYFDNNGFECKSTIHAT